MFPELLKFSSSARLLPLVPDDIRDVHKADGANALLAPTMSNKAATHDGVDLWDEWADNENHAPYADSADEDSEVSDAEF